jgi:hypothetical protein
VGLAYYPDETIEMLEKNIVPQFLEKAKFT